MSGNAAVAAGFDYSVLPADLARDARKVADQIRTRLKDSFDTTGRDLITMKSRLGHRIFRKWLAAEFQMSERTAENYMAAARLVSKSAAVTLLPPDAVYALAAPSASPGVVAEVIAALDAGDTPTVKVIKQKLTEAAAAVRAATIEASKTPEQRERQRKVKQRQRALHEAAENRSAEEDHTAHEQRCAAAAPAGSGPKARQGRKIHYRNRQDIARPYRSIIE